MFMDKTISFPFSLQKPLSYQLLRNPLLSSQYYRTREILTKSHSPKISRGSKSIQVVIILEIDFSLANLISVLLGLSFQKIKYLDTADYSQNSHTN